MSITIGQPAPQFTLPSTDRIMVSLSDFKGKKVVIHFFPFAFTGTCTTQLCTVRDDFGFYEGVNAEVLAISVDSPFSLKKFKEEQGYQFTLLSDFNKEVSTAYGAFYDEFILGLKGVSKRAAFVLNENQEVIYAEVLDVATDLPDFEVIAKHLK
ncbi:peroxiredoxin [Mucilaginibacter sp. PPCGB 2223]|uniref:redoxin domain-containing protein n=1 Tax=Mucilaginibacter sp. PPCGB 2223 TaxID=1886027 RepID=UPI0008254C7A|nr:redoxin domain-containing protein [Mucilaginibacter sp. PPCGB 2223]OCX51594.1 peroxiredoxin [Mucilaginibacter sp. PPCGB 2223]